MFWQGWVRKVCLKEDYKNYYKVAVSFPGREPFYPYVDEFLPLPKHILDINISSRNYIADGWRQGYPGKAVGYKFDFKKFRNDIFKLTRPSRIAIEEGWQGPSIQYLVEEFINELKFKYRNHEETIVLSPTTWNSFDGITFGFNSNVGIEDLSDKKNIKKIEFKNQLLEPIESINKQSKLLTKPNQKFISIFPRKRNFRREDKNWKEKKYKSLMEYFLDKGYSVVLMGEPSGAYFHNLNGTNIINLIGINPQIRLNEQILFLKKSICAIGAMSGATLMALATGCPTIIFGYKNEMKRYKYENYMNTPMLYVPQIDPEVRKIINEFEKFIH